MVNLMTTEERISKAREIMDAARSIPIVTQGAFLDLGYVAKVKDTLRQARDLIKFIQFSPAADAQTKQIAMQVMKEIETAEKEILRRKIVQ